MMSASARKKQRVAGEPEQAALAPAAPAGDHPFRKGSIVRIRMHHFLTYHDIECQPGSRLNMIVGPNGSGKSSVACAINIVCAGDFKNSLQRPKSLLDFIKKGESEAWVEAEFFQAGKHDANVVVRRTWDKRGSDRWGMDGRPSDLEQVRRLMERLNIQVDNLCVFLAQERVANFSQMKPVMLLEEVQKAVSRDLYEQHQRLCRDNKRQIALKAQLDEKQMQLRQFEASHSQLEEVVALEQERQLLVQQLDALKLGRAWARFHESKAAYEAMLQTYKEVQQNKVNKEKALNPLKTRLQWTQRQREAARRQEAAEETEYKSVSQTAESLLSNVGKLREKLETARDEVQEVETERKQLEKQVVSTNAMLEKLLAEQASQRKAAAEDPLVHAAAAAADPAKRAQELERRVRQDRDTFADLQGTLAERRRAHQQAQQRIQEFEARLRNLGNHKQVKLEQLCKDDWNIQEARRVVEELTQNGGLEQPVYGPLFLHVEPESEFVAQYLETALGRGAKLSFICQTKKDFQTLQQKFRDRRRPVNVRLLHARPPQPAHAHRGCDERLIARHGGRFLDSAVRAEEPVMWALMSMAGLHRQVYLDEQALAAAADGPAQERIRDALMVQSGNRNPHGIHSLFMGSQQFRANVSRYGNREVTTAVTNCQPLEFFGGAVDPSVREGLQQELAEARGRLPDPRELEALEEEMKAANDRMKEGEAGVRALRRQAAQAKEMEQKIQRLRDKLKQLQQRDFEAEMRKRRRSLEVLRRKGIQASNLATKLAQDVHDNLAQLCNSRMALAHAEGVAAALEAALEAAKKGLEKFEADVRQAQQAVNVARARAKEVKEEAKQLGSRTEFEEAVQRGGHAWAHLRAVKSVEDFDSMVRTVEARLASMRQDSAKLKEYEQSKARLERYRKDTRELEHEHSQLSGVLKEERSRWEAILDKHTKKLSEKFAGYYQQIRCQGEVRIKQAETFDKWGLEVYVSYRKNEPLSALSAKQSGGERSVATMLFLLSLQAVTDCPFRVVDEINQAMDPRNERMVFQQIVHSTLGPTTPQYFLISPSLLPNLQYDPQSNICILNVLCGVWFNVKDPVCMAGHRARALLRGGGGGSHKIAAVAGKRRHAEMIDSDAAAAAVDPGYSSGPEDQGHDD